MLLDFQNLKFSKFKNFQYFVNKKSVQITVARARARFTAADRIVARRWLPHKEVSHSATYCQSHRSQCSPNALSNRTKPPAT